VKRRLQIRSKTDIGLLATQPAASGFTASLSSFFRLLRFLTTTPLYGKFLQRIVKKEMNIMKQVAIKSTVDMLQKIETIQKEVMDLKVSVLKKLAPTDKKVISLKGILKNVDITEEDITSAKKSLYGKVGL
jgi:hypothetical protein